MRESAVELWQMVCNLLIRKEFFFWALSFSPCPSPGPAFWHWCLQPCPWGAVHNSLPRLSAESPGQQELKRSHNGRLIQGSECFRILPKTKKKTILKACTVACWSWWFIFQLRDIAGFMDCVVAWPMCSTHPIYFCYHLHNFHSSSEQFINDFLFFCKYAPFHAKFTLTFLSVVIHF